jgi:hypothetical protein
MFCKKIKNNLWFLTEERPKKEVLATIFCKFAEDYAYVASVDSIHIFPILNDGVFTFTYEVIGLSCKKIDRVFIKTVSGNSSFVDYMLFYQKEEPIDSDIPIYVIEETKTDDSESRNTGVYQRCSKFVFIDNYYQKAKKIMLYNLQIEQKKRPTQTYIFGTKLLLTLGVEILGKRLDKNIFTPFETVEELIDFKSHMRKAPSGNIPILITKIDDKIQISGRLYKSDSLSHDPNIGALSIISAVLRKLGWKYKIEIVQHGLEQRHIGQTNKFIQIANKLNIDIFGLNVPKVNMNTLYWRYDKEGEKLGTIFIHLVVENFTKGHSIFENHAGCERGYFITSNSKPIALAKYKDRKKYKMGQIDEIINIPDLILIDFDRGEVIDIEGKKYNLRKSGIRELKNYNYIEEKYVLRHYPEFKISRTVVLYGSEKEQIVETEVGFLLNSNGKFILGTKAPEIFKEAIKNLLDFWN